MTTGQRMKIRRKEIGLSAERVAEILGVSPATIYRYENGDIEKVPGDSLVPIAEALHTTPAYLMGWADSPAGTPQLVSQSSAKLTIEEQELIRKFRRLDERGKAAVLNVLEHEYTALPGDTSVSRRHA